MTLKASPTHATQKKPRAPIKKSFMLLAPGASRKIDHVDRGSSELGLILC